MAAMLPVAIGMYAGQHLRDKIAPETFRKLVLIAVIAAGADLLASLPGKFQVVQSLIDILAAFGPR
jgi:uncharacterized membrane protein YfcA